MKPKKKDVAVSRRKVVKGLVAAAVAGSVGSVRGQTKPATTQADDISPDDVASLDKIAGRHNRDADRAMMAHDLDRTRKRLMSFRNRTIDPNVDPALHFNPRLTGTKLPTRPSSIAISKTESSWNEGDGIESLAFASVVELASLIKSRRITSIDLTKMYLDRLKRFTPKLLCTVNFTEALAMKQAKRADQEIAAGKYRSPLHGIPYGAKDLLATKGTPTTWGVSPYKDRVFDYDATVISRLEAAGAVLIAKLSLGELAMGDIWFGGKTRNPWKPAEGSSGSSAGPGSATAAGCVGFAIGSETLGSIVSPCVVNGTTGLRPTWGRVSRFGAMPLCPSMDKLGPMARAVEDCAIVLSAICGADEKELTAADVPFAWDANADVKALRVGIDSIAFDALKDKKYDAIRPIYEKALEVIRSLVGDTRPVTLPPVKDYAGLANLTIGCESAASFTELTESGRLSELVQQEDGSWPNTFRIGATIPAADYLRGQQVRAILQRQMRDALAEVDCYITIPFVGPTSAYTNLTGHPSVVTRCGMDEGLPKSIEFIGQLYREDQFLLLAYRFERATEHHTRWPVLTES